MIKKEFESDNLYYVKISEKFINDYLKMINDYEINKYISHNPQIISYDEELNWIKQQQDNQLIFSIIEKETDLFVGNIELMNKTNYYELGIIITSTMQNKGYGTEAIKRIIKYAKDVLDINEIFLNVYNTNNRAIHVYKKIGFKKLENTKTNEDILMNIKIS